jgi:hypothetical protein
VAPGCACGSPTDDRAGSGVSTGGAYRRPSRAPVREASGRSSVHPSPPALGAVSPDVCAQMHPKPHGRFQEEPIRQRGAARRRMPTASGARRRRAGRRGLLHPEP